MGKATGKSKEKPPPKLYLARPRGLVDLVWGKGLHPDADGKLVPGEEGPAFLMKDGRELLLLGQVAAGTQPGYPPPKAQIPWQLPNASDVEKCYTHDKDGTLYDDLVRYLKSVSELPGEGYYDLLATWVLHTYLLEHVHYSPIIWLHAVQERGKTRTGKALIYLAYRGLHVESLRDAYLVRLAENFQASIFFDVREIWKKAERNETDDLLLLRFEKGTVVPRVIRPEAGPFYDTAYYSIFGSTIIATNEDINDKLESRAIQINMPEARREFENAVTEWGSLALKERLVAFRARHLDGKLPHIPKPAKGRLGDILKPLQQIIRLVKPSREPAFLKLVEEIQGRKLVERTDSFEADVVRAVRDLKPAVVSDPIKGELLAVEDITERLFENWAENDLLTPSRVGKQLQALGFKKARCGAEGRRMIVWDARLIAQLQERYGLSEPGTATPETKGATGVSPRTGKSGNNAHPRGHR
jgi:hypothetical protein